MGNTGMSFVFESDIQTYVFYFARGFLVPVGLLEREGRRVRYLTGGATKPLVGTEVGRADGRATGFTTGIALGSGVGGVIGLALGSGVGGVIGLALGSGVGGVTG
jgi:hypothetical protein